MKVGRKVRGRIGAAAGTTADYVRGSAIYGWLTKEPEPEVIVIDLRETRTVGPFIRLLDRVVDRVEPIWAESRLKAGVDRGAALADRGLDSRPGRLLVALLEPPEPPDAAETRARSGETGDAEGAGAGHTDAAGTDYVDNADADRHIDDTTDSDDRP